MSKPAPASTVHVTTQQETLGYFPVGEDSLFGILTYPTGESKSTCVTVLAGATYGTSAGRNRLLVRLCRRLAADGYHTMRFDYHGIGESTGQVGPFKVDKPFVEDVDGALRWVTGHGVDRFVLMGTCFGARTALATAATNPRVAGVILVSMPIRHDWTGEKGLHYLTRDLDLRYMLRYGLRPSVLRGFLDPQLRKAYLRVAKAKWETMYSRMRRRSSSKPADDFVSDHLLEPLKLVIERRVPILFLYGTADNYYGDFQRAMSGRLRGVMGAGGALVEVKTLSGRIHALDRIEGQDSIVAIVEDWLGRHRNDHGIATV